MSRIDKQAVLYLHKPDTDYECQDCSMWLSESNRCTIHAKDVRVGRTMSCGFFVHGMPMKGHPMGYVTPRESGLVTDWSRGYSCKRCTYFISSAHNCWKVDKDSIGDDPHEIHPDACCNEWTRNPAFA